MRLKRINVANELITNFLLNGLNSCKPITVLPNDIRIVGVERNYTLVNGIILIIESDEFVEIAEGATPEILDIQFEQTNK